MRFTLDGSPEEISAFLKRVNVDEVPTTDQGDDAAGDDASMVFETPAVEEEAADE